MIDDYFANRGSAYGMAWDCLAGIVRRDRRSGWARLWCACFVVLICVAPVTLLLAEKTDARLGNVLIYALAAAVWTLLVQAPMSQRRRAVARKRPFDSKKLIPALLIITTVELTLLLPPVLDWWNRDWPEPLRAVAWGIILPTGWLDLLATTIALILTAFDGYPIHAGR